MLLLLNHGPTKNTTVEPRIVDQSCEPLASRSGFFALLSKYGFNCTCATLGKPHTVEYMHICATFQRLCHRMETPESYKILRLRTQTLPMHPQTLLFLSPLWKNTTHELSASVTTSCGANCDTRLGNTYQTPCNLSMTNSFTLTQDPKRVQDSLSFQVFNRSSPISSYI